MEEKTDEEILDLAVDNARVVLAEAYKVANEFHDGPGSAPPEIVAEVFRTILSETIRLTHRHRPPPPDRPTSPPI